MVDIHTNQGIRLYPAQENLVSSWATFGPRAVLSAETGAGKTFMTVAIARTYKRILVVCPALVKYVWQKAFTLDNRESHVVRWGRERKNLTKAQQQILKDSYAADIQIISYALIDNVHPTDWDFIVFDEVHHLANPHAITSKHCEALLRANPQAAVLGLSATLIPTNVIQLWNPLRLIAPPSAWPKGNITSYGPPWNWLRKYVGLVVNDYGTVPGTPTQEQRVALQTSILDNVMHVSLKDIMPDMPPLRLDMLEVDQGKLALEAAIQEWCSNPPDDVTHQIVLCATRAQAAAIANKYNGIYIDGSVEPHKRNMLLAHAEMLPHALVVATYESLIVGIRLLWVQRALLINFNGSPGEMTQLLGRFRAVGTTKRPLVQVLMQPENERTAEILKERLTVVTELLGSGATETQLDELLKRPDITVEQLRNALFQINESALNIEDWTDE